jgi:hypothetical protein
VSLITAGFMIKATEMMLRIFAISTEGAESIFSSQFGKSIKKRTIDKKINGLD